MKTTTALIVLESGKIAIGEMPLKDGTCVLNDEPCENCNCWHKAALKESIDKAVECADQEKAKEMIKNIRYQQWIKDGGTDDLLGQNRYSIKTNHQYPIPGIRYEVRKTVVPNPDYNSHENQNRDNAIAAYSHKLAYIISPPPLAKEEDCKHSFSRNNCPNAAWECREGCFYTPTTIATDGTAPLAKELHPMKDPKGYATAAAKILDALKLVIGVDVNEYAMPIIIQIMKNNITHPLLSEDQEDLWLEVFKYNYREGLHDTLTTAVKEYLSKHFSITRREQQ